MKFMCMAYEEEQKLNELSVPEWHALREETLSYVERLKASGHLIDAHPLQSARTASTLRVRHGKVTVTDGPFAETKEQLGGFFLVEAGSKEEALDIASRWPGARIGTIEVRPVDQTLSPDRRYA
jgi:hypothetical protein